MDVNKKKLAIESIDSILKNKTLTKAQRLEMFENRTKILHMEIEEQTEVIRNNQIELRLLQPQINKLSNVGWKRFQQ